ncbi:MAG: hypothetical protein ACOYKN_14080 [Pirellula sp.]
MKTFAITFSTILSLAGTLATIGTLTGSRFSSDTHSSSNSSAPGVPRTPVLDTLSVDWRSKVKDLEANHEILRLELQSLRKDLSLLDKVAARKTSELERQLGTLSESVQSLEAAKDSPPAWLPGLLTEQNKQLEAFRIELASLKKPPTVATPTGSASSAKTANSVPVAGVQLEFTLRCGCPASLELSTDGRYLLVQKHRDGTKRTVLTPVTRHRGGWSDIAQLPSGLTLTSDPSEKVFELVAK